jgi:hypothetical protein
MKTEDEGDLAQHQKSMEKVGPAFLFDLDGTLVDSVYQHVRLATSWLRTRKTHV